MFTQWVPHTWATAPYADELDAYADRVIERVDAVAPGFTSSILHRQVIGPYEMEHEYGLIGGNIFHGELSPDQLFHMRPAPGYADFRTPIDGLYQASSATHGGGGVTGIPGLNATRQIVRDRAREAPAPCVDRSPAHDGRVPVRARARLDAAAAPPARRRGGPAPAHGRNAREDRLARSPPRDSDDREGGVESPVPDPDHARSDDARPGAGSRDRVDAGAGRPGLDLQAAPRAHVVGRPTPHRGRRRVLDQPRRGDLAVRLPARSGSLERSRRRS